MDAEQHRYELTVTLRGEYNQATTLYTADATDHDPAIVAYASASHWACWQAAAILGPKPYIKYQVSTGHDVAPWPKIRTTLHDAQSSVQSSVATCSSSPDRALSAAAQPGPLLPAVFATTYIGAVNHLHLAHYHAGSIADTRAAAQPGPLPRTTYIALSTVPTSLTTMLVALLILVREALLAAALAALLLALLVARDPKPHMLDLPLRSVLASVSSCVLRNMPPAPLMRCRPPVRPSVMRCIQPSADARSPARELQRPPGPACKRTQQQGGGEGGVNE